MEFTKEEFDKVFDVFKVECEEHIKNINAGLIDLEKDPRNLSFLSEIFRFAHSLKGAGRIMGFTKIERVSHGIENVLDALRRGEIKINSSLVNDLYAATDLIQKILLMISEGKKEDEVDITATEKKLNAALGPEKVEEQVKEKPKVPEKAEVTNIWERRKPRSENETSLNRRNVDAISINTLRVATAKLDFLMNQVDELLLARIRGTQRLSEFEVIKDRLEEWNKQMRIDNPRKIFVEDGWGREDFSEDMGGGDYRRINRLYEKCEDFSISLLNQAEVFEMDLQEDNQKLNLIVNLLEDTTRKLRMMPISTAVETFPRMIRDLCQKCGKEVDFELKGGETELDKKIIEEIKDPLMHLVLNSFDHGIELAEEREKSGKSKKGKISLTVRQKGNVITLELEDDGQGLNTEKIKEQALKKGLVPEEKIKLMSELQIWDLIFKTGFSTSEIITNISGRGVGMDVVRNNVEKLKGNVVVESVKGKGTKFILTLPLTLATLHILLVEVFQEVFALPSLNIETTLLVSPRDVFTIEGKAAIDYKNHPIPLVGLGDVISLADQFARPVSEGKKTVRDWLENEMIPIVVLSIGEEKVGFFVDRIIGEQETVMKNMGQYLKRVKNVIGATLLGDGRICIILNPSDLIRQIRNQDFILSGQFESLSEAVKPNILLVDDSITTRTFEKNILEAVGYEVDVAVDGEDAYKKIKQKHYQLVITDVEMPKMDGFSLTRKIKTDRNYKDLPVIVVTSLDSDEYKKMGVEAGADAYITKGSFDRSDLLDTIQRLI